MTRKLNVKFLAIIAAVTLTSGIAVYYQHKRQVYRSVDGYLQRVDKAEAEGDFRKAAYNLRIYLMLRPSDFAAMSRYAVLLSRDETKATRDELERAANMIEVILVRDREHPDLRLRLVKIDMQLKHFGEARAHLMRLLGLTPQDGELHDLMGEILEEAKDYASAARSYETARKLEPSRLSSYPRLARLLRVRLQEAERADAVMDAGTGPEPGEGIVSKNPDVAAAYVERGWYRQDFRLPGAAEDAARAIGLAPDDLSARLLAAEVALRTKPEPDLKAARSHLAHATLRHPLDARIYRAAAEVELRARDVKAAIVRLERGVKAIPNDMYLRWLLIDLQIQAGSLDDVDRRIAELRAEGLSRDVLGYLEAELLFGHGKWAEAARAFEANAQLLTTNRELEGLAKRLFVSLGECYERLGNTDQRYLAFQRAVKITPSGRFDDLALTARTGLASSLIALGRVDQGIEEYRKNLLLPDADESIRVTLARLLIFRNLRLPEPSRRWDEVERLLQAAERSLPDSSEVIVLRAESLAARRQLDPARKLLEEARDRHPDQVELWVALANLAIRQERAGEALPILDAAEKRLGNLLEIRVARAKYWAGRGGADAAAELVKLAKGAATLPPPERTLLLREIAEAHVRLGEIPEAKAIWTSLASEEPNNLQVRLLLFDAATAIGDDVEIEAAIAEIRRIEGEDGSLWRFGRAYQMIKKSVDNKDPALREARRILNDIAVRRPAWARVILSIAEIDDRQENTDTALKNYQRAIDLGEQSPRAIRRTIQLFYQIRRYDKADQVLRRLQDEMPISAEMQRLAADVSLQIHDYTRALELARRAVSGDSADYRDLIWLGQLLWSVSRKDEMDGRKDDAKARRAEAERSLRRSVELGGAKPEAWLALIQFLSGVNNLPAAEKAILDAEKAIPIEERALPLALANESIGRTQRAEILYKEAVDRRPDDATAVQALANFYVNRNRIADAKPLLYRLIELKAKAPEDARWAGRILAIALSMEGREKDSLKALEYLNLSDDRGDAGGESNVEDLRAKAIVYSTQRNRDRRREAIRLLDTIAQREEARVEDRILLAQLFDADGNWSKARDQYVAALTTDPNSLDAMSAYAMSLARRNDAEEARKWMERLRSAIPGTQTLTELEARLAVLDGKPENAGAVVRGYVRDKDAQLPWGAGLLETLALYPAAEELYRRHAAQPGQPLNTLILAEYLGRRGRVREALDLCDRAWLTCPVAQVAETSLKVLFSANASPTDCRRVADHFDAAIKAAPDDVSLAFGSANVLMLQDRRPEAEAIFRRVFDRNPTNASPLNNLAWLLAMQEGKAAEALETIDRAISIDGSVPEYLDTRGLIHLSMGRNELALKELEDSVAVSPSADNYFHLARAYVAAKRNRDAIEAFREARNLGLKPETLHPFERRAYDQLVAALPKK